MAISVASLQVAIQVKGAKEAERDIAGVGDAVDKAESKRKMLGGGLIGLSGLIGGVFTASSIAAIGFGEAMSNVNSIAQLSTNELSALSDQVLELSTVTGQGPETLAAGLYDVYSSGFAGAEGLQVLTVSANAANAGLTTTAVAAKAVTAVLNAYDLTAGDAAHVSDVLFQTVNEGVITFEELSTNMGNTLPIANSLGVSFEELAAGYAVMTKNGVPAAQAETQLAALMRSAINPTQALTDATLAYGYATPQALIAAEGFTGFLNMLTIAAGGSGEKLFDLVGTAEGVNAALLLGGQNADEYTASVGRMEASSEGLGATQIALSKQMESTAFSLKLLRTNLQAAAIAIGVQLEPGIKAVAKAMTAAIKVFLGFSKPVQQVIGIVTALVGVVAGAAGAWILFGGTISAIASLLASLALPILAIVAAVAGLYLAWQSNFMGIRDITSSAVDAITGFLEPVTGFLGTLKDAWDATAPPSDVMAQINAWGGIATENMSLVERAMNALDVATGGLVSRLQEMTAVDVVVAIGSWVFETAVDLGSALFGWIGGQLGNLVQNIPAIAVNIAGWIKGTIPDLWDTVMSWGFGGGGGSGGDPTGATGGGAAAANSVTIGSILVNIAQWAKGLIPDLWEWVETTVAPAAVAAAIEIPSIAVNIGEWTMGVIADIGAPILTWATEQIAAIDFTGVGLTLKTKFFSALGSAFSIGGDIGSLLGEGISLATSLMNWVTEQIEGVHWPSVGSKFAEMLGTAFVGLVIALPTLTGALLGGILVALVEVDWAAVGTSLVQLWVSAMTGLGGFFVGFATTIYDELSTALGAVDWAGLGTTIKDGFVGAVAGVGGAIGDAIFATLPGWLTDLINGVVPGVDNSGTKENTSAAVSMANLPPSSMDVGAIGQLQGIGMLGSAYITLVTNAQNAAEAVANFGVSADTANVMAASLAPNITALAEPMQRIGGDAGPASEGLKQVGTSAGAANPQLLTFRTSGTLVIQTLAQMSQAAMAGMGTFRAAIVTGMSVAVAAVRSGVSQMVAAARSAAGAMAGAGADAIGGLVRGVSSGLGALNAVVNQVLAIMARIPGMGRSPWPSMIGAGQDAMDGLIIGNKNRMPQLAATIGNVIDLFDVAPRMNYAGAMSSVLSTPTIPLTAGGGLRGGGGSQTVTNHIDARFINNAPIYGVEDLDERLAQHTNGLADALERNRVASGVN